MTVLRVDRNPLHEGRVRVAGFKHALVPVIAASLFADRPVTLRNVPRIEDALVLAEILKGCGADVSWNADELRIDGRGLHEHAVPGRLSRRIHGSVYLIPGYLGRIGAVRFEGAGGCLIGDRRLAGERPVDHMLAVLERFGAKFDSTTGGVLTGESEGLHGCNIDIMEFSDRRDLLTGKYVSGATKTALLAAAASVSGETVVQNPYTKPDVSELVAFLIRCGRDIRQDDGAFRIGAGKENGPEEIVYDLMSDGGEIMTWIAASAYLSVPVSIGNVSVERIKSGLKPELDLLEQMGIRLAWLENGLIVTPPGRIRSVDIDVTSLGIYSDHQPLFALMLTRGDRRARIREFVWENRFDYAAALGRMGARLERNGASLDIWPSKLRSPDAPIHARDLRSAAMLLIAAVGVEGSTTLCGAEHLCRGYEDLIGQLRRFGALIRPVKGDAGFSGTALENA